MSSPSPRCKPVDPNPYPGNGNGAGGAAGDSTAAALSDLNASASVAKDVTAAIEQSRNAIDQFVRFVILRTYRLAPASKSPHRAAEASTHTSVHADWDSN